MQIKSKILVGFLALCVANSLFAWSIFKKELDCNIFSKVDAFEGHFYGITSYIMGYDEALILTEDAEAYIAIPDTKEENEFLLKFLDDKETQTAFIGIYDGTYTANYCVDDEKCAFDDRRFVTVKNKPIYYKNWADKEPNNKLAPQSENERDFSKKKGEHYVLLNKDGKWADVGLNERHKVILEFDEQPRCIIANTGAEQ